MKTKRLIRDARTGALVDPEQAYAFTPADFWQPSREALRRLVQPRKRVTQSMEPQYQVVTTTLPPFGLTARQKAIAETKPHRRDYRPLMAFIVPLALVVAWALATGRV